MVEQGGAVWPDRRCYLIAFGALAVSAMGLPLPAPWSAVWGLGVTLGAVVVAGRWLGGGLVGAWSGALVGGTAGTAAATPLLVEFAFAPFVRGEIVADPSTVSPLLVASLARVAWASLAGTIGVPAVLAAITACFPRRAVVTDAGRPSRVLWILLGYRAVVVALPVFLGVGGLLMTVSSAGVQAAATDRWSLGAALLGLILFYAALLVLVGVVAVREILRAVGPSGLMHTLLFGGVGTWLLLAPGLVLALAFAVGPVSGISGWGYGLPVTLDDVREMYRWSVPVVVLSLLAGMAVPGILFLLAAVGRWGWRRGRAIREAVS